MLTFEKNLVICMDTTNYRPCNIRGILYENVTTVLSLAAQPSKDTEIQQCTTL